MDHLTSQQFEEAKLAAIHATDKDIEGAEKAIRYAKNRRLNILGVSPEEIENALDAVKFKNNIPRLAHSQVGQAVLVRAGLAIVAYQLDAQRIDWGNAK